MARIRGTNRKETLFGTAANDIILGLGGDDTLKGGAGNDKLDGGSGKDKLFGGKGDDKLIGGLGDDQLNGDAGNDTLIGGVGADVLNGGAGVHDVADYSASSIGIIVDLTGVFFTEGQAGDAQGDTYSGVEDLIGTALNDILLGDSAANTLRGGLDNDILDGGDGNDILNGGADDDTLKGGGGVDTMTGATGEDVFQFLDYVLDAEAGSGIGAGNRDIITDFREGFDLIDLSDIDADTFDGGNQTFVFIDQNAFTNANVGVDVGQVRFFQEGGNTIIEVDRDDDANNTADFQIELAGLYTLTGADFIL